MRVSQTPFAVEWNAMVDYLESVRVINGPGVTVAQTQFGTATSAAKQRGASPGGSFSIKRYLLKSVQDDYLTCQLPDTSGDVYIAKPKKLRCSLASATIFSTAHTYTYAAGPDTNNKERTHTVGAETRVELVIPPWVVDDDVFAVEVNSTGVDDPDSNEIKLHYFGDDRQWAAPHEEA